MKERYLFLDMLRALAVAEMIHGHSLDGLLSTALKQTPFYVKWTVVRGYTAPVFLFAAGFAFAIVTLPRIDLYSRFSAALLQRIRRFSFVVLLGYLMYLPYFSLRMTILSINTPAWDAMLRVDILRCIGVTLLLLQVWVLLKPKEAVTWAVLGLILIGLPLLTPAIRQNPVINGLPAALRFYFVDSRFPLVFYSSFLLLGFLIGMLFSNHHGSWLKVSLAIAAASIAAGFVFRGLGGGAVLQGFLTKAGVIILLLIALERCEKAWKRLPSPIKYFGQESLVVYVVHLMVVYGSVLNKGMVRYWGATLSYGEVYLFILWLFTAMLLLSYVWHTMKLLHAPVARRVKYGFYASFVALFLLKPY